MKSSFGDTSTAFSQMQNGYEAHYLKFEKAGSTAGLLLVNMDHSCQTEFRAYIRHISVMDATDFDDALKMAVNFIWHEMYAETIRIDLYHFKDESGALKANQDIKVSLGMEKKGFKWKTMLNDPATGKRYQIMQMNKPKDLVVEPKNDRKLTLKQEPITLKAAVVLRLYKDVYSDKTDRTNDNNKIELPYCMMSALQQLKSDKQISNLESMNPQHAITACVDKLPSDVQLQGVRAKVANDKEQAFADAKSQNIDVDDPLKSNVSEYVCSVLSSVNRLPPFDFHVFNGYSFLRVRPQLAEEQTIMHSREKNIWFMPLQDPRI